MSGDGQGRGQAPGQARGDGQGRQQEPGRGRQPGEARKDGPGQQQGARGQGDNGDRPPVGSPHGVHAGLGGSFTGSVPALVVGGLLIAGALAAALHRVWPRRARSRLNP
ncbi:hypothetical protein ACWD5Q_26220 [Streptomyces sp. NPDC002513]